MRIDVITIFPELFGEFLHGSIVGKARERKLISVTIHDLRDYTTDKHKTVDDSPYGGGPGMVMKPEPWFAALGDLVGDAPGPDRKIDGGKVETVLLTPRGERLNQRRLEQLAACERLVLLCGRYEGLDDRIRKRWVTSEISLGDFVINGGELAAQAIIEGVTRLQPEVLSDPESARQDSFSAQLLDHGHYTRPPELEGMKVPQVLLSGNHKAIRRWRLRDSIRMTYQRRPDLLEQKELSEEEKQILEEIKSGE